MRTFPPSRCSSLLSSLALACLPLAAQEAAPAASRLTEASLFKNGMAYLAREVDISGPGVWRVSGLPTPVHGTFWILPATSGLEVKGATALMESVSTRTTETQLSRLLFLNAGRILEVKTSEGWLTCEVLAGAKPGTLVPASLREEEGSARREGTVPAAEGSASDYVLLKTDKGILATHLGAISGIRAPSGSLITEYPSTRQAAAVHITSSGAKGKVHVVCLTRGLSWAPSYLVDVSNPKEAVVRGKAVIMNDLENLGNANLNLIAGFPNLQFSHAVDAFTPSQSLDAFLRGLDSGPSRGSNAILQQAVLSNAAIYSAEPTGPTESSSGEAHQDLFFHTMKGVTLKKGERGYQPMFEHRVPYQHVFVWEVGDTLKDPDRWREGRSSQNDRALSKEEVWHQLRLKHTGNVPWSTGPAMTLSQDRILGQDTLHFTPSGGSTLLRITRAMDVTAEQSESEASRLRDAPTPYPGHWDLVTLKGELQVANRRGEAVNLLIKKDLMGELGAVSLTPSSQALPEGLKQVNRQMRLTWEAAVPAKEKLKISYTYKVLVSR